MFGKKHLMTVTVEVPYEIETPLEDAKRRMELKLLEIQVEINTESQ